MILMMEGKRGSSEDATEEGRKKSKLGGESVYIEG